MSGGNGLPLFGEADCACGTSLLEVPEVLTSKISLMLLPEPDNVSITSKTQDLPSNSNKLIM